MPVNYHSMMLTFNQIYESINSISSETTDVDESTLLYLKYEEDEIEKIYRKQRKTPESLAQGI